MGWQRRKRLCLQILEQMQDFLSKQEGPYWEQQIQLTKCFHRDLVGLHEQDQFKNNTEEYKEKDTAISFMAVMQFSLDSLRTWAIENNAPPPNYMTKQQAKKKFKQDYLRALQQGDEHFLGMNLQEWEQDNKIIIVNEDQLKQQSSSEKEK